MTVQQDHRTAAPQVPVRLPEQRRGEPEPVQPPPAPPAPQLRGWGSEEDRTMARRLLLMMVTLSLYASLFVALGSRAWG